MALIATSFSGKLATPAAPDLHKLTIVEQPNRVLLAWSGPVEPPMRNELASALDRFKGDNRRLVISLNSPGGSIAHGEEVMAAIRSSAQRRPIDTLIQDGGVCASMCVSIFLLGDNRIAGPNAQFMFHEASISAAAEKGDLRSLTPDLRIRMAKVATDMLFESYSKTPRINGQWLKSVRAQITKRDIWMNGQKLVQDGSGVVDVLVTKAD